MVNARESGHPGDSWWIQQAETDSRLRGNDGIRRGSSRRHPFKMFEHLVQIRSPAGF
jgi:hypothetical protein